LIRRLISPGAWLRGLAGWRRMAAAIALGAFSALAFAPIGFFPALLLGFAALALLLEGASRRPHRLRAAAALGWGFGFGQFLLGLHWIVYPFMVDPGAHLWQLPFAISLLPAGLGLFGALACAVAALPRRGGAARLILRAACWSAAEWLRGHVLTGFPWNLPAYGWGAVPALMQSGALLGAYGLSFLTVLFGVSLAELAERRWRFAAAMTLLFAALWGYGAWRLMTPPATVPGVALRLVQPDVPQSEMRLVARNWQRLLRLSNSPGRPTHIIWPEAAAAFPLERSAVALDDIARLTARGAVLFTGTIRMPDPKSRTWYNSLYLFSPGARTLSVYDKTHLVPFGEYVPWPRLMSALGIAQLIAMPFPATPGNGLHRYLVPGAPFVTPLICYEDAFPGAAISPDGRPGWFVNVTDDSWFGPWAGPAQHLLNARMRSIEEGIPMARAANTGISAVIDAKGRIVASLALGKSGVVDAALPQALPPTPYARFGDLGFAVLLLISLVVSLAVRRPR
jgi:apolipoprotein N-acyltransferase